MKVKIFDLTLELYCKVKNLNFQISLNQLDKIIFFLNKGGQIITKLILGQTQVVTTQIVIKKHKLLQNSKKDKIQIMTPQIVAKPKLFKNSHCERKKIVTQLKFYQN